MNFSEYLKRAEQHPEFREFSGPEKWETITHAAQKGKFTVDPTEKDLFVNTQRKFTTPVPEEVEKSPDGVINPSMGDMAVDAGKFLLSKSREVGTGAFNNAAKIAKSPIGGLVSPGLRMFLDGLDSATPGLPETTSSDFKNVTIPENIGGFLHDSALMSAGGPIVSGGGKLANAIKGAGFLPKVARGLTAVIDDAIGGAASSASLDAAKGESLPDISNNAGRSALVSGVLGAGGRTMAAGSKKLFSMIHKEYEPQLQKALEEKVLPRMMPDEVHPTGKVPSFREKHIDAAKSVEAGDSIVNYKLPKLTGKYTPTDDIRTSALDIIKDKLQIKPGEQKATRFANPNSASSYPADEAPIFNRIQKALAFLKPVDRKVKEIQDPVTGLITEMDMPIMRKVGGVMQDVTGYTDPRNVQKVLSSMRDKSVKDVTDLGSGPVAKLHGVFKDKLLAHIDDALSAPGITSKAAADLDQLRKVVEATHDEGLAKLLFEKIGKFTNSTLRAKSLSTTQADPSSAPRFLGSLMAGFGSTPLVYGNHYGKQVGALGKYLARTPELVSLEDKNKK